MESITKTIILDNGDKVEFARLELEDLFSLTDALLADKEAVARQLGKEENLERYEVINMVLDLRSHKPTIQELLANCSAPQGAAAVLRKSLDKSKVDKDKQKAILAGLSIPDCVDVARMLILDVQEKRAEPTKEATDGPLPQSPSTSPQSAGQPKGKKTKHNVAYYGQDEQPEGTPAQATAAAAIAK